MDLIRIELIKIVKRKDFLILLSMIFLPVLYTIGLSSGSESVSYEGTDKITGLYFASQMYVFVYMLFVYYIILAVCVIRSFKGEIESGSIQLYVQRINNRGKIFASKRRAYVLTILGITILLVLFSMICFGVLVLKRPDITSSIIVDKKTLPLDLGIIFAVLVSFIFTIDYSLFLSAYRKSFEAMGLFIFTWVACMYFKQLDIIKFAIPIYYVEKIANSDKLIAVDLVELVILVTVYSCIFTRFGKNKFLKSDLA